MRIIKEGNKHLGVEVEVICRQCQSELGVKKSDGRIVYDHRDGDYIEVQCPVCSRDITISIKKFDR